MTLLNQAAASLAQLEGQHQALEYNFQETWGNKRKNQYLNRPSVHPPWQEKLGIVANNNTKTFQPANCCELKNITFLSKEYLHRSCFLTCLQVFLKYILTFHVTL